MKPSCQKSSEYMNKKTHQLFMPSSEGVSLHFSLHKEEESGWIGEEAMAPFYEVIHSSADFPLWCTFAPLWCTFAPLWCTLPHFGQCKFAPLWCTFLHLGALHPALVLYLPSLVHLFLPLVHFFRSSRTFIGSHFESLKNQANSAHILLLSFV